VIVFGKKITLCNGYGIGRCVGKIGSYIVYVFGGEKKNSSLDVRW
jgi:hypothetical protein